MVDLMADSILGRILIVDDEPLVRDLVRQMLDVKGYRCSTAGSGEEALLLLQSDRYDAVITDLMMPGMSGADLVNVVKILYPQTVLIVITGLSDPDTNRFVSQLGVDGHLIKPFSGDALRGQLVEALAQRTREPSVEGKKPEMPLAVQESECPFDPEEFTECVKAGMSDAELMDRYRLTGGALRLFLEQLVSSGLLKRSDLNARASLSPGSVMLDMPEPPPTRKEKPVINAKDAVACIRSGMDDVAIMNRYGISALGLRSLFLKLVDAGLLSVEEMYRYCAPKDGGTGARPRTRTGQYLAVAAPIYEKTRPDVEGSVLQATEQEIHTTGIPARVGEAKAFVIPAQRILQADEIPLEAVCLSVEDARSGEEPTVAFRITKISGHSLKALKELIAALTLDE